MGVLSKTSVMVTGGCGFIGSHLVRRLLAEGVRRVSRSTACATEASRTSQDSRKRARDAGPLHAGQRRAGSARPASGGRRSPLPSGRGEAQPVEARSRMRSCAPTCSARTHLFAAAARGGVKKTVFTSSLYSYGRLAGPPCSETDLPVPTTVYGISKLCGERLLAHHATPADARRCLRYFFVFGPRQFAGIGYKSVIVKNFERIRAPASRRSSSGDGSQRLDYVFVDDVVEATLRCMESPGSGRAAQRRVRGGHVDRGAHGCDAEGGGLAAATGSRAAGLDRGKLAGREHRRDPHGAGLDASRHARARGCARPGAG